MPPARTPAAAPKPPTAPHAPSAMLRSRPSVKVVVRIESADGVIVAAPSPWRARAAMSDVVAPGQAAEQRADGEDDEAAHEDASPPEDVGEPAAEQEEAAEDERVGAEHPLQVLLREAEIGLDRRQRDVHDRDVEDDHELHGAEQRQREPFRSVGCDHRISSLHGVVMRRRTGGEEGDIRRGGGERLRADFGDAPLQEAALRLGARELEGAFVLRPRLAPPGRGGGAGRPASSGSTGSRRGRAGRRARGRLRPRPPRPRRSRDSARRRGSRSAGRARRTGRRSAASRAAPRCAATRSPPG